MISNEEKKELFESVMKMMAVEVKRMINEADSKSKDDRKEEKKGGKTIVFTGKSKYFKGDDVEKFIRKNTSTAISTTTRIWNQLSVRTSIPVDPKRFRPLPPETR